MMEAMEVKGKLVLREQQHPGYPYFVWVNDGKELPLPPYPFVLREPAQLVIRLKSTGNGKAAWWRATGVAENCLNEAPFCPVFRGIVQEFSYSYQRDAFASIYQSDEPDVVIQGGAEVINFYAKVAGPIPDPFMKLLKRAVDAVKDDLNIGKQYWQGSLMVAEVLPYRVGEIPKELLRRAHSRRFFNHYIIGRGGFNYRVIDGVAWGILKPISEILIVSPDHLSKPLFLTDTFVYYVLMHRFPTQGGDVD